MKNRILTNSLRTIKKAFPRFVSLTVMSALGVFAFAGLQATKPDMIETLDRFLDAGNVYDLYVVSDMGLMEEDIRAISDLENVEKSEGVYEINTLAETGENESVLHISSLPQNINQITLTEGTLPQANDEIVVEKLLLENEGLSIGDTIRLKDDTFQKKRVTIVGVVESPLYYNYSVVTATRGNTNIGSGKINYYSYMMDSAFDQDYYSAIYAVVSDAKNLTTSSKKYLDTVDMAKDQLEAIKKSREAFRYDYLYQDIKSEIDEKEADVNKELKDAAGELADAYDELSSAKEELDDAKKSLNSAKRTLASNKKELDNAKAQIDLMEQMYPPFLPQVQMAKAQYEEGNKAYQSGLKKYNKSLSEYNENCDLYEENLEKYQDSLQEYKDKKQEAKDEIADARKELDELDMPHWYIYDRTNYSTYVDYIDDSDSIGNLSKIFPVVFFLVAVLISLISMNRMVEDDRLEIGTLKSLGFSNHRIMSKYVIFSLTATIFGGGIGGALGLYIIPNLIFGIYKILFTVPNFVILPEWPSTIAGFAITVVCVCGTSILTVYRELLEKPSELMRPKAPKNGKRILLERITFIWKRLKFSNKITIRNIFRYKKRVLVTIFGIAGCTALMLCGYGIRDSIRDIAKIQYDDIYKFDGTAYAKDLSTSKEDEETIASIFGEEEIIQYTDSMRMNVEAYGISAQIFAVQNNEDLDKILNLYDYQTKQSLSLAEGKVVITEKFAELSGKKVGDEVFFMDDDHIAYSYEVSGIAKNYLEHYFILTEDTLNKYRDYEPNIFYFNTNDLSDEQKDKLTVKLLSNDEILNVSFKETLIDNVNDMLKSLNKVVLILIVLAALLSFVVLYNLSNINIRERRREIATLKVLGFFDREVDNYITKENIIITILGIAIGLALGVVLSHEVVATVEIEKARFVNEVRMMSFVYSALMSVIFTCIVNFITHFNLKKIDMIDSLKSVE